MLDAVTGVGRVTPADLADRLRAGSSLAVLDVRRRGAWTANPARVPGAIWVPLEEIPKRARELSPETRLVVYCD